MGIYGLKSLFEQKKIRHTIYNMCATTYIRQIRLKNAAKN